KGIPIGHAGQVITNCARPAVTPSAFPGHGAEFRVMLPVVMEEFLEDLSRPNVWLVHNGVVVEVFVKKTPQLEIKFTTGLTVLNKWFGLKANLIRAAYAGLANEFFGRGHHILNLQIDDPADDKITAAFIRQ